jgi:hypothetical protein
MLVEHRLSVICYECHACFTMLYLTIATTILKPFK